MSEFLEALPENYREAVANAGIDSMDKLVQNWADAQSAVGSSIRIPGPDAGAEQVAEFDNRLREKVPRLVRLPDGEDPEEVSRFYGALGRPEAPDGYAYGELPDLEVGSASDKQTWGEADRKTREWISGISHKANLTNAQAQVLYSDMVGDARANVATAIQTRESMASKLREDWGQDYEQRMAMAGHVLKVFGGDEGAALAAQELDATGLSNSPAVARILHNIASNLSEDQIIEGGVTPSNLGKTAEQIKQTINEMRGNKDHPMHDAKHPSHGDAMAKLTSLYEELGALNNRAA